MLFGTLGAGLLGIFLTRKGTYRSGKSKGIYRAGGGIVRAGYGCPSHNNNKRDF